MAQILEREGIHQTMNLCPFLTHLPQKELYARYDEEADVLYLQFQQPANIHISEIRDDGIIVEYAGNGNRLARQAVAVEIREQLGSHRLVYARTGILVLDLVLELPKGDIAGEITQVGAVDCGAR